AGARHGEDVTNVLTDEPISSTQPTTPTTALETTTESETSSLSSTSSSISTTLLTETSSISTTSTAKTTSTEEYIEYNYDYYDDETSKEHFENRTSTATAPSSTTDHEITVTTEDETRIEHENQTSTYEPDETGYTNTTEAYEATVSATYEADNVSTSFDVTEESENATSESSTTVVILTTTSPKMNETTTYDIDETYGINNESTSMNETEDTTSPFDSAETESSVTELDDSTNATTPSSANVTETTLDSNETDVTELTEEVTEADITNTTSELNTTYVTETSFEITTTEESESTTYESSTTVLISTPAFSPKMDREGVCDTKACKEVGARMLDIMHKRKIDPCEDFYKYSCDNVIDKHFLKIEDPRIQTNNLIKEALTRADRDDPILKELLVVYDSCLNYTTANDAGDRLQNARKVFESLGYKFDPRLSRGQSLDEYPDFEDNFDLTKILAEMMKMHFSPFFDLMIDVSESRHEFMLKLTLSSFTTPFSQDIAKQVCFKDYKATAEGAKLSGELFDLNTHYASYVNCKYRQKGLEARMDRMTYAVQALDLTSHIPNNTYAKELITRARTQLNFMLDDIQQVMPPPPEIRRKALKKEYEQFTLSQLDDGSVFTNSPIKFTTFVEHLIGEAVDPDNTHIQVYFKDALDETLKIMNDFVGEPSLQNMMLLLWTERVYGDLVAPVGLPLGSEGYCFNAVTNLMDDYVTYLYLRELPQREYQQKKMKDMIGYVKNEAMAQLSMSTSATKSEYEEKLTQMTGEVANFGDARDSVTDAPLKLEVMENDFTFNYQHLLAHYRKRLYALRSLSPSEHQAMWGFLQFTYNINGVTSYALNKFLIPHAAMSPPYYYGESVPDYINYAGIGQMIAHELIHGFDSIGVEFNKEDRTRMMTDDLLVGQTECLGEELTPDFNVTSLSGINYKFTLPRDLSLNELLADSAASKLAWDAYEAAVERAKSPRVTTPAPMHRSEVNRRRRGIDFFAIEGLRNRAKRQARRKTVKSLAPLSVARPAFAEMKLEYMTGYTPRQLFYIKTAQNLCSATSELDMLSVMEREHLPSYLRVNLMMKHDPMFAEAFQCPVESNMVAKPASCQFSPLAGLSLN
ncbi:hypothetical protein SK128_011411, partial [Halocaridina rubra]